MSSFLDHVAIPFRVGWGFSRHDDPGVVRGPLRRRNPFQGGMGFFTYVLEGKLIATFAVVAIPFRVGWGFSPDG